MRLPRKLKKKIKKELKDNYLARMSLSGFSAAKAGERLRKVFLRLGLEE